MFLRYATLLVTWLGVTSCRGAAIGFDGFGRGQVVLSDGVPATRESTSASGDLAWTSVRKTGGFVAFGDSYSAGIGTGVEGKENECRRGVHAYPSLIYQDLSSFQGPNSTDFQWLSCTGATTDKVLSGSKVSQIDQFNTSLQADFATLSIGGNDLGFFDVLNACVFRFYSYYSGTCEAALAATEEKINSTEFEQRLDEVVAEILDKAEWEKRPWFSITVTGYARFFNADTPECDDYSLGVWWRGPKLKRELRAKTNELVLRVNAKLRAAVDAINARFVDGGNSPKLIFVDFDERFEGHRFCEPGVVEPEYNRTDTWFFLVGGPDNAPVPPPPPPSNDTAPAPTSASTSAPPGPTALPPSLAHPAETLPQDSLLIDPDRCLEPAKARGDWGELALCYMAMARHRDPTLRLANGDVWVNSMWYVPTYYGKVFHPVSSRCPDV